MRPLVGAALRLYFAFCPQKKVSGRTCGLLLGARLTVPLDTAAWRTCSGMVGARHGDQKDAAKPQRNENQNPFLPLLEDLLFETIAEGQDKFPVVKFITALKATGLRTSDPRLKDSMDTLRELVQTSSDGVMLDKTLFRKCVAENIILLTQAFRRKFVIPDFENFTEQIDLIYENAKGLTWGKVADYIPQLAKFDPNLWGVSLCTVDGQRHSIGDTKLPFCLQSCMKPFKYAIAAHDLGTKFVHQFVGKEPSGLRFDTLSLNENNKPHNPMVNAGSIVVMSLIKQSLSTSEKFDYVMDYLRKMAGFEYVAFNNSTFQSERETGDRNFAIAYYLKEKKCFPEGIDVITCLDFYFQLCSIEVTCESASVMAATLANGGICPITGERLLNPEAVRNTLSLMHSCGMYDFSGQFAFHVGLPAKSGVAGGIMLVVPNVMGMMCWSPPLDQLGNSVRGIQFSQEMVSMFNFHNYDNLRHFVRKLDPRRESGEVQVGMREPLAKTIASLLFSAHSGDLSALRRFALSAMDMDQKDYDYRSALHVSAAEGHLKVVRFLLEICKVNPLSKDRWGFTSKDEANRFGHMEIVQLLEEYEQRCINEKKEHPLASENLEGMV
uniref:glutaminase kidney isoform, mitochondrial-like isoform X1 n=1 Tax=Myxine glutinosa TaxID=7769 RepID=UPI003590155B